MIGKKLFPFRLAYINERKKKKFLKDSALWVIVFGALYLLVFYNYVEVK